MLQKIKILKLKMWLMSTKKSKVLMYIIVFLGVILIIYDIASLINIGLNVKYQIDVFENGDNITEFKNIIKIELQKSFSTILLNLVYIIILLIALLKK